MRIALIEDDQAQVNLLTVWIEAMGHDVVSYTDGAQFVQSSVKESFDLAILDWMLPSMSGIEVLDLIRANNDKVPVLFVTAKDDEKNIVEALEAGADDYMIKPVSAPEIKARMNALLRRASGFQGDKKILNFPPYEIDSSSQKLTFNGEEVNLTQKEYQLIVFLFRNEGRVISRGHLLQVVWGTNPQINTRTVDTHVSRLRSKLDIHPETTGWELKSIYQHGYRLEKN